MATSESENGRQARQARRRRERQQFLSRSSLFALGFVLSLAGALYVAWLVYPLNDVVASPAVLQASYKADYIYMVSQAYAQDGDWPTAEMRLSQLEEPDLPATTLQLLEDALREGREPEAIRNLARLAEQLGAEGDTLALFAPTPVLGSEPTAVSITPTLVSTIVTTATAVVEEPIGTVAEPTPTVIRAGEIVTATAVPIVATPEAESEPDQPETYRLLSQREVCQSDLAEPRIEVVVVDLGLNELRGVEVLLASDEQNDRAITGFKSEQSAGYADFAIELDRSYTVEMEDGSGAVGGLQSGRCANDEGPTGWILRYQSLVSE